MIQKYLSLTFKLSKSLLKGTLLGVGIFYSSQYILPDIVQFNDEVDMPMFGSFSYGQKYYNPVVRIIGSGIGCSATIIDDNYALTAAHCVYNSFRYIDSSLNFNIYDEYGQFTGASAVPAALDLDRDIALLKGDFKQFNYAEMDFMGFEKLEVGDKLVSCGFPSSQTMVYCVDWKLVGSYDFQHVARGIVIQRGCSGGPVFNKNGKIIGVNSAVRNEDILVGPTVGVLSVFGIEPQ